MLKAYSFHDGDPTFCAVLVFAHNFREAKKIGCRAVCSLTGCEFFDVRGFWIRNDGWLKANAANREKLAAGESHVIYSPPPCKCCDMWHDELDAFGYCEACAEDREEEEAEQAGGEK